MGFVKIFRKNNIQEAYSYLPKTTTLVKTSWDT